MCIRDRFSGGSSFTQNGGMTVLSGGSLGATSLLAFEEGTLSGVGTIGASVLNTGARVQPGGTSAAGTLLINGDYTQGAQATLAIDLGGTIPGTDQDQLVIGGTAVSYTHLRAHETPE